MVKQLRTKWLAISMLFVILFSFLIGTTPSTYASNVSDKRVIVMGTSPDYPPFENTDALGSGEIIGLDIDIAKHIANELGYELEIVSIDFGGLITALQTGRIDFVMSGMSATEERKQSVDFSTPYYFARNTIVSKAENNYETLESLSNMKVGAQLGSIQEQVAESVPNVGEVKKLNKIADLIQEINANRISAAIVEDAVAIEMTNANSHLVANYLPTDTLDNGYAIAFPKGSNLVQPFNQILSEMEKDGTLQRITNEWFPEVKQADEKRTGLNIDFSVLKGYVPYILEGVGVTLLFTLVSAALGLVLGSILSLFKISNIKPLKWFATAYTSVFRGTPLLVQLTLIYYATPQLTGYDIPALLAAGLAFGLNSAAYLSETIRAGIMAVDKGQTEAAIALGVPYRKMMFRIILPQALKNILPALVNECVALVKESSLVSVIGVADLMRRADIVRANTFTSFEVLLLVAAIYYVLVLALTSVAHQLERRLRRGD